MTSTNTIDVSNRTLRHLHAVERALTIEGHDETIQALARLYARENDDLRVIKLQDGTVGAIEYVGDTEGKRLQSGEVVK